MDINELNSKELAITNSITITFDVAWDKAARTAGRVHSVSTSLVFDGTTGDDLVQRALSSIIISIQAKLRGNKLKSSEREMVERIKAFPSEFKVTDLAIRERVTTLSPEAILKRAADMDATQLDALIAALASMKKGA